MSDAITRLDRLHKAIIEYRDAFFELRIHKDSTGDREMRFRAAETELNNEQFFAREFLKALELGLAQMERKP